VPVATVLFTALHFPVNSLLIYLATILVALALCGLLVPMEHRINDLRRQIASGVLETVPAE
jgi:hypothetical protein